MTQLSLLDFPNLDDEPQPEQYANDRDGGPCPCCDHPTEHGDLFCSAACAEIYKEMES